MSQLKVNSISDSAGANGNAITLASDGSCTVKATNNLSNRNKLINGSMAISQRSLSKTGAGGGDGYWIADRWRLFSSGAARFTVTRPDTSSGQPGFPTSYKFACTTADTSLAAGEYLGLQQILEGQDVQDFLKGTSSAKAFTLSFYIKTNKSGVYTVELNDNDNTRQISKTFTVSDGNWNRYTVTFPADTTGAFDNDNGNSLQVNFWLIAGTNYTSGTLNSSAWAAKTNTNRVSSSNVNIGDSTSNTWEITGVQLEVDSTGSGVATDFEHRSYSDELQRCMRYFELLSYNSTTNLNARKDLVGVSLQAAKWYPYYKVVKRTEPAIATENFDGSTVDLYNYTAGQTPTFYSVVMNEGDEYQAQITINTNNDGGPINVGSVASWRWKSSETAWIGVNAELV